MEAIPSASGESPAADGIFFAIAYKGAFPDVARIKTNRMGDSWRATVPLSDSGRLSVRNAEGGTKSAFNWYLRGKFHAKISFTYRTEVEATVLPCVKWNPVFL